MGCSWSYSWVVAATQGVAWLVWRICSGRVTLLVYGGEVILVEDHRCSHSVGSCGLRQSLDMANCEEIVRTRGEKLQVGLLFLFRYESRLFTLSHPRRMILLSYCASVRRVSILLAFFDSCNSRIGILIIFMLFCHLAWLVCPGTFSSSPVYNLTLSSSLATFLSSPKVIHLYFLHGVSRLPNMAAMARLAYEMGENENLKTGSYRMRLQPVVYVSGIT